MMMKLRFRRSFCKIAMAFLLITFIWGWFLTYYYPQFKEKIQSEKEDYDLLNDFDNPLSPSEPRFIFFLETSSLLKKYTNIDLTPRQACAVESAATLNPELTVYLIYVSSLVARNQTNIKIGSNSFFRGLMRIKNIKIRRLHIREYILNSPLGNWHIESDLDENSFIVKNAPEILKILTLWKYNSLFLELDMVVMRNFRNLKGNFACIGIQSEENSSVLNSNQSAEGFEVFDLYLKRIFNIPKTNKDSRASNDLSKVFEEICHVLQYPPKNVAVCRGFKIFPPSFFHPVPIHLWRYYFNPRYLQGVLRKVQFAYAIHVWDKESRNKSIKTSTKAVYTEIARQYCPSTLLLSGEYFN